MKKNGFGRLVSTTYDIKGDTTNVYEGEWSNDKKEGYGIDTYYYPNEKVL